MLAVRTRWDMRLTDKEVLKTIQALDKPTSEQQIADMLDCDRRTLQRAIKRLKNKGILEKVGNNRPTVYQVNSEHLPDCIRKDRPTP